MTDGATKTESGDTEQWHKNKANYIGLYGSASADAVPPDIRATDRGKAGTLAMMALQYETTSSHCLGGPVATVSDRGWRVRGSWPALA